MGDLDTQLDGEEKDTIAIDAVEPADDELLGLADDDDDNVPDIDPELLGDDE